MIFLDRCQKWWGESDNLWKFLVMKEVLARWRRYEIFDTILGRNKRSKVSGDKGLRYLLWGLSITDSTRANKVKTRFKSFGVRPLEEVCGAYQLHNALCTEMVIWNGTDSHSTHSTYSRHPICQKFDPLSTAGWRLSNVPFCNSNSILSSSSYIRVLFWTRL